jgi:hypothetical protein
MWNTSMVLRGVYRRRGMHFRGFCKPFLKKKKCLQNPPEAGSIFRVGRVRTSGDSRYALIHTRKIVRFEKTDKRFLFFSKDGD